jgi:hypothetical protein
MARSLLKSRWLIIAIVLPAIVYIGLTTVGHRSATAAGEQVFLDWQDGPPNWSPPFLIPPNCATWHEISPAFCNVYHQDTYNDNGDGVVSPCDIIALNGIAYHVDTAGPTVYLDCSGGGQTTRIIEPVDENWIDGNPYDTQWMEIWPNFGVIHTIDGWNDGDASGDLTVCDIIIIAGQTCHVKRIGCNIRVTRVPTATEESTWGKVKGLFQDMF